MYEDILYEVQDGMGLITLNRPQQLNAWGGKMATEMRQAVESAANDPEVVAIVITGAGKGFCAGADLSSLTNLVSANQGETADGDDPAAAISAELSGGAKDHGAGDDGDASDAGEDVVTNNFAGAYTYLMAVEKPVIAAINGAVAGMAVPMVLSCDLRFMADEAVIVTAFVQRGLIAEFGTSWLLARQVGPAHALDMLFSSRKVDGQEAARMGFVNRSMPLEELMPYVRDYVSGLARMSSPSSMAVMKRQVYSQLHDGLGAAERESLALMAQSFRRPDFAEGVKSFLEQREPQFNRLPVAEG